MKQRTIILGDQPGETRIKVLSIDAIRTADNNWQWNDWHTVGTISKLDFGFLNTNRQTLRWFRDQGYLSRSRSPGQCSVYDDGYNLVIIKRGTREPIYAIEYGPAYL